MSTWTEEQKPQLSPESRERLRQRSAERRAARRRAYRRRQLRLAGCGVLVLLAVIGAAVLLSGRGEAQEAPEEPVGITPQAPVVSDEPEEEKVPVPQETADTVTLVEKINSQYAIVVDRETGEITAQKAAQERIYPASMTKVLSLIVAVEEIEDLEQGFTMTSEIIDPVYRQGATTTGLSSGETVPLRDLLYGMILPSGADAAEALAIAACGSSEAFVKKMNEKVAELGLSATAHFANASGLHDENQYCTVRDMAMILEYALRDETCREVLTAMYYTTTPTQEHPEGISYTNLFLYRIEGRDMGGAAVVAGKTGYVNASGSCIASCGISAAGKEYICVTGDASGSWKAIYDHMALYTDYAK